MPLYNAELQLSENVMSYSNVDYEFSIPRSVCTIPYIDNYNWSV